MIRYPHETPPAEGQAITVAEGVLWMRLPLPMALDHVNVYALDEGDGWTIVDTGFDSRRSRAIWQALIDGPLQGRPIRRVIGRQGCGTGRVGGSFSPGSGTAAGCP